MRDRAIVDQRYAARRNQRGPNTPERGQRVACPECPADLRVDLLKLDGDVGDSARDAIDGLGRTWSAIFEASLDQRTPAGDLAAAAQGALERGLAKLDHGKGILQRRAAELERGIAEKLPKLDASTASEVRAYWREQGNPTELAAAARADATTAAAILSAPGYLSGLADEKSYEMVRSAARRGHAPEEVDELAKVEKLVGRLDAASRLAVDRLSGPIKSWSGTTTNGSALDKLQEAGRGE